jgi:hypothetical protein
MIEYVVLAVLAALILSLLVGLGIDGEFGTGVRTAVCRVVDDRGCRTSQASGGESGGRPEAGTTAGPKTSARPKPDSGSRTGGQDGSGCGFLGTVCAFHAVGQGLGAAGRATVGGLRVAGQVLGGVGSSALDTLKGFKALVTTNPLTTLKNLRDSSNSPFCAIKGLNCLAQQMIVDPETELDILNGRGATAAGRITFNIGSLLLPAKIPGLSGLGKAGRIGDAGRDAGSLSEAGRDVEQQLANARNARTGAEGLSPERLKPMVADLADMSVAERTRFLDQLSTAELQGLYRFALRNDPNTAARILQDASPEALRRIDPPNPPYPGKKVTWTPFTGDLWGESGADYRHVAQGDCAEDCSYLAGEIAIARQNPGLAHAMIQKNPNGTYTMHFPDGPIVTVTADLPSTGARVPATGPGWPAIMEKGAAQLLGGYDKLDGHHSDVGLIMLIGAQRAKWSEAITAETPGRVADAFRKGYAITLNFKEDVNSSSELAKRGIVARHAYAVVWAERDGTIVLANPWGPATPEVRLTPQEFTAYVREVDDAPTR